MVLLYWWYQRRYSWCMNGEGRPLAEKTTIANQHPARLSPNEILTVRTNSSDHPINVPTLGRRVLNGHMSTRHQIRKRMGMLVVEGLSFSKDLLRTSWVDGTLTQGQRTFGALGGNLGSGVRKAFEPVTFRLSCMACSCTAGENVPGCPGRPSDVSRRP